MTKTPKDTPLPPAEVVAEDGAETENEVLRAAREAKELALRAAGKIGWKTAAGIGVGSAALIAALLYANRGDKAGDE